MLGSEFISENLAQIAIAIGFILLCIEVWVLGLSTILLLALGISSIISGLLMMMNLIPSTLTSLILSSSIVAASLTFFLWKPLKRFQQTKKTEFNTTSDFIGLEFDIVLDEKNQLLPVKYSGITWQLVLPSTYQDHVLTHGDKVRVIGVEVGRFFVEPV